jgi:hypothetical protein
MNKSEQKRTVDIWRELTDSLIHIGKTMVNVVKLSIQMFIDYLRAENVGDRKQ